MIRITPNGIISSGPMTIETIGNGTVNFKGNITGVPMIVTRDMSQDINVNSNQTFITADITLGDKAITLAPGAIMKLL